MIRKLDDGDHRGLIGKVIYEMSNGTRQVEFTMPDGGIVVDIARCVEPLPKETQPTTFESKEYQQWIAIHGHSTRHCNRCGLPRLLD